eukprot:1646182-Prymnesium_polylepis.1
MPTTPSLHAVGRADAVGRLAPATQPRRWRRRRLPRGVRRDGGRLGRREAIEREMFPGRDASEVALLQGHDVVGETERGRASAPRRAADPPLAARPAVATPVAAAA